MRASEAERLRRLARIRAELTSGDARRTREAAGMPAVTAARKAGVSRQALWKWEAGKATPNDEHALAYGRLLAALGNRGE